MAPTPCSAELHLHRSAEKRIARSYRQRNVASTTSTVIHLREQPRSVNKYRSLTVHPLLSAAGDIRRL